MNWPGSLNLHVSKMHVPHVRPRCTKSPSPTLCAGVSRERGRGGGDEGKLVRTVQVGTL